MSAWSLPGRTAATASSDLVPRQLDRQLTAGIWINPEDYAGAFAYENRHGDFAASHACGPNMGAARIGLPEGDDPHMTRLVRCDSKE
jgi:hypothetical protein